MIQRPKLQQLLGIALLGIWGLLGFRIGKRFYSDKDTGQSLHMQNPAPVKLTAPDTFSLILSYPDPFFENTGNFSPSGKEVTRQSEGHQAKKKRKPALPVPFPRIRYQGMIRSDRTVGVLIVDGENVHLGKGEKFKTVRLLSIAADSVRIQSGREIRTIPKE